jgi:hypothetical protein
LLLLSFEEEKADGKPTVFRIEKGKVDGKP